MATKASLPGVVCFAQFGLLGYFVGKCSIARVAFWAFIPVRMAICQVWTNIGRSSVLSTAVLFAGY